jgi:hypothetical protein
MPEKASSAMHGPSLQSTTLKLTGLSAFGLYSTTYVRLGDAAVNLLKVEPKWRVFAIVEVSRPIFVGLHAAFIYPWTLICIWWDEIYDYWFGSALHGQVVLSSRYLFPSWVASCGILSSPQEQVCSQWASSWRPCFFPNGVHVKLSVLIDCCLLYWCLELILMGLHWWNFSYILGALPPRAKRFKA